jgi:hypothetical protein
MAARPYTGPGLIALIAPYWSMWTVKCLSSSGRIMHFESLECMVPTNLPDGADRVRRERAHWYSIVSHVAIALIATLLIVWNIILLNTDLGPPYPGPNPFQGGYSPAEFGKRPTQ